MKKQCITFIFGSFKTKTDKEYFEEALKSVKYIISPYIRLNGNPEDCTIVEFGREKNLHVAWSTDCIGSVTFSELHYNSLTEKWSGKAMLNDVVIPTSMCISKRNFSLKDGVLYIGQVRTPC